MVILKTIFRMHQTVGNYMVTMECGTGSGVVILNTKTKTKVLTEEVGILQLAKETQLEVPITIDGIKGHGVETTTDIKSDIIAMLVHLCAGGKTKYQGREQDEYAFHILYCLFILILIF